MKRPLAALAGVALSAAIVAGFALTSAPSNAADHSPEPPAVQKTITGWG